jgi:hypothetical protein
VAERRDQLGMPLMLGHQAADQRHIPRAVDREAALDRLPELSARVAQVGHGEHGQLGGDHGRDHRGLVGVAAIDRGLAHARLGRDGLDGHPGEPRAAQQPQRGGLDRLIDLWVACPSHNVTQTLRYGPRADIRVDP